MTTEAEREAHGEAADDRDFFWVWVGLAVFFSVLFHVLLYVIYTQLAHRNGYDFTKNTPPAVSTRFVTPAQLQAMQQRATAPSGRPVVETERAAKSLPVKTPAKYLGEHTQRVERETRSQIFGSVEGGKGHAKEDHAAAKPAPKPEPTTAERTEFLKKLGISQGIPLRLEDKQPVEPTDEVAGDGRLSKGSMDLSSKDIAAGARTILNTDEYVYASFFNRVKREVAPRWEPLVQHLLGDRQSHFAQGLFITETNFWLNSAGQILRVEIAHPSGERSFDEAARDALMRLPAMPNPPEALREADGSYRMQLGFVVNLERSGIRMDYVPDPRL